MANYFSDMTFATQLFWQTCITQIIGLMPNSHRTTWLDKPLKSVTNSQWNTIPTVTVPAIGHYHLLTCTYPVSPRKRPPFYLLNNSVKNWPSLIFFGMLNPEKILHENVTDLSTSPVRCSHFTLGNPKNSFFNIIIHILQTIYVSSEENEQQLLYCNFRCLLAVV